jgi:HD-GYP domain-containing protein (c-di-GMP phosphodiesterase class II)
MSISDKQGLLGEEVTRLRRELADHERQMREREQEFERYSARLRDAIRREQTHADQVSRSYVAAVRALTNAVEARDAYTGKHAERVAAYGLALAEVIDEQLTESPETEFGFLLHDVGKVAVPDSILHKPGPLNAQERCVMQRHPVTGSEIVSHIGLLDTDAGRVVRHHHERWDGLGYPDGLIAEQIPVAARIFAVADTLDAVTTKRPYRAAASLGFAREVIEQGRGTQFCPTAADALAELPDEQLSGIRAAIG